MMHAEYQFELMTYISMKQIHQQDLQEKGIKMNICARSLEIPLKQSHLSKSAHENWAQTSLRGHL